MSTLLERIAAVAVLAGLWWFIGGQSVWWGLAGFVGGLLALAFVSPAGSDPDDFAQQRMDDDGGQHKGND